MASIPTTIPCHRNHARLRGFTLVELLVSTSIGGIILVGVLASVLMIVRSGYLLNNYIDMEKEARIALETIAVDARVTETISWHRANQASPLTGITLTAPGGESIRYDYDSVNRRLTRRITAPTVGVPRVVITSIQSLTFSAYKYADDTGIAMINPATTTTASMEGDTKMLQISLSCLRTRSTLADATNNVVSARYVLRNKLQTR